VSSDTDPHARAVRAELMHRGLSTALLDTTQLGPGTRVLHVATGPVAVCLPSGQLIRADEVTAVWHRRRFLSADIERCVTGRTATFLWRQWRDCLDGFLGALSVPCVNPIPAERWAVKPRQLNVAVRCGLRVPETVVTNDAQVVRCFVERHAGRVVHKVLQSPDWRLLETRRWDGQAEDLLASVGWAPCIFQEEVESSCEVRAIVVGSRVFAASFKPHRDTVDGRLDRTVSYQVHELPQPVCAQLVRLVRCLGLVYAAIDLKAGADAGYVFLELNPGGQYLYVERATGLAITSALADLIQASGQSSRRRSGCGR
jgi:hypothetical protein